MPGFLFQCMRLLVALGFLSSALAQAVHRVVLGVAGSIPDPPTTAAQLNDIVTFVFGNGIHGVTQTSFETPCVPLLGGFNSGLVSALNTSEPVKTWDLRITNASQPIWFYCQATRPLPHCANGMVGSINALPDQFVSFQSAAKAFTGTQDPSPTVVLAGVGALATNSPSAPPGSVALTPTPSPSPMSTATVTVAASTSTSPVPASSAKSTNAGALAGGLVGGLIVLAIIITLALLLYRANRRQSRQQMHLESSAGTIHEIVPQSPRSMPQTYQFPGSEQQPFVNIRGSNVPQQQRDIHRQLSSIPDADEQHHQHFTAMSDSRSTSPPPPPPQGAYIDVRGLAKEIAALVQPGTSSGSGQPVSPDGASTSNISSPGVDSLPIYGRH